MNDLEKLFANSKNRSNKESELQKFSLWSRTGIVFLLTMVLGVFVFTSCEEEDPAAPNWKGEKSVLGRYAHETQTMHSIPGDQVYIQPGSLPYLETGRDSFSLEGMTLVVPGRVMEEEGVDPSEMMAVFPVSEEERPVRIPEMEMKLKKSNGVGPMWWSFSGSQFFPNDQFTSGGNAMDQPPSRWMPESMEDMQILVYNGNHDPGKLFGNVDWSDQAVEMGTTIESEKEQLAVAVPFDRLANFNLELKFNLAEVIHEDPAKIDFPVEKGFVDPKPTASFFSGITMDGIGDLPIGLIGPNRLGDNGFNERLGQVTMIDGQDFFPDDVFTPTTVSVFTIPVKEMFPDDLFMPYVGSSNFGESRLLLFGSDAFSEAPNSKWTHHQPGEEMDVSNTKVMLPNSILAAGGGGSSAKAILPPSIRAIGSSGGETFFPNDVFYPDELKFPDCVFMPEEKFHFTRPDASYSATAIQEMGREIDVSQ